MPEIPKTVFEKPLLRYSFAIVVVGLSFLLRYIVVGIFGFALPPYITFYPGIMLVALLAGLGPGLLATVLALAGADYLILPPVGRFEVARTEDLVALILFASLGILMSLFAHLYRRNQRSLAALKEEQVRHRSEGQIQQLNRIYSVLSDINQTIVREKDLGAMLQSGCRIAVEKGQFRMAWIGMIDAGAQILEPIASSGFIDGYLDRFKIDVLDPKSRQGPAAQAVLTGTRAICNDIEHDPAFAPWRIEALRRGYRSSAGFPLKVEEKVVGVFVLYATEAGFFAGDELALLDEMAMDVSFALEVNRLESERRKVEQHIRRLNRVYDVLSEINQCIVREKDSRAMLESACRIAVEKGQFRMAWIGMVDAASQRLQPIAWSGIVNGYLDRIKIDFSGVDETTGPAERCFHTGIHAICSDIENELDRPWKGDALGNGYRSLAAFPLRSGETVIGIFCLYASELAFFDDDEIQVLDEMAMDISYALEVNRREEERKKAEEELRWRTAFFEAQVDSAMDGVLVVDSRGKKILQNVRLNELLKLPQHIFESADFAERIQFAVTIMKDPDRFLAKVDYLVAHPNEISLDLVELRDGTILERYSAPVMGKAMEYYGRIWTFRDITEKRHLEEQYRQAQKMEAIGQLTGGIAHDFNNQLTVILGCAEYIGREVRDNPKLSKMADMVMSAAKRGADLTHRMLAFARRQALQPRPTDVNRLIEEMRGFLCRTLSAEIDLRVIPSSGICNAMVDATQLESALLNLCVNARDAMPSGGCLTIEAKQAILDASYAELNPEVTPGPYVLVVVSDTGCGISAENLERVFDPFFTTKGVGTGTGLGLSMVYGFAKQSRGHAKIYSEPGHGTTVRLYLPRANQTCEPVAELQEPQGDLRGSEVILLVEDNSQVREFAKSQLIDLGYRVLEASDSKEALQVLGEHENIDLLFTDVVMPGGMNGRELAQKACKANSKLKVLYCSGYAESAIVHQGLLDKGVELLNKPYTRLDLAGKIRQTLTGT